MKTVQTPQGEVTLLEPPVEILRAIRSYFPYGAFRFPEAHNGADFGLVMQCGEDEVLGVKQQPTDCDEKQSLVSYQANSILIADSFVEYLGYGFSGVFMPCPYIRTKPGTVYESGITYFCFPSKTGREALEYDYQGSYDGQFGHGFTTMMTSFIRALQKSSKESGISLSPVVGLDVRRRSDLGTLGFGFMALGPHVICLKTRISEDDPVWTTLRSTGIKEVIHVPSVPATITKEDLAVTKDKQ
jgi:hypothetical protein